MSYDISYFIGNHRNTTEGKLLQSYKFSELASEFTKCAKGGKFSAYFVRGGLSPFERKDENLESSNLLIIDGDEGIDGQPLCSPEEVHEALVSLKINHFIYTTHSHNKERNKFRVVIASGEYVKADLKTNNSKLLGDLLGEGIGIKYVKEMNTWSQPWFVPTRDEPGDGLFRYFGYFEGSDWKVAKPSKEVDTSKLLSREPVVESVSLDEMYENIRTGKEYHESLRTITYQYIKDGMNAANVKAIVKSLLNGSQEAGSERWQTRYNDVDRLVDGAVNKTQEEFDILNAEEKTDDVIPDVPWPPGLLGDLCDSAYDSMKLQHRELALMSGLGVVAGITGRKFNHVHSPGFGHLGLNVYMSVIGSTGIGKSGMEKFAKWVFSKQRGAKCSFLGPSSFTGAKALMDTMALQLSMLSISTEAGIMLQTKSGDQEGLMSAKLNMYAQSAHNESSDSAAYSSKDNSLSTLYSPAYSQLSESTPDVLFAALTSINALKKGLLPRQSLFVIPDSRKIKRNYYAKYELSNDTDSRLNELMELCSQVQTDDDPKVIEITFGSQEMREEAEQICDMLDSQRDSETSEGQMVTRMYVKLLKYVSLISVFNQGLNGVKNNILEISEEEWKWAKDMHDYETKINGIFLEGMSGSDELQQAIEVVVSTVKRLLMGVHPSSKAQAKVTNDLKKVKCIHVNTLRDVLAKSKELRAMNSSGQSNSIKTGLDKVLEYLVKSKRVSMVDRNPLTGKRAQMIKALEAINDTLI